MSDTYRPLSPAESEARLRQVTRLVSDPADQASFLRQQALFLADALAAVPPDDLQALTAAVSLTITRLRSMATP